MRSVPALALIFLLGASQANAQGITTSRGAMGLRPLPAPDPAAPQPGAQPAALSGGMLYTTVIGQGSVWWNSGGCQPFPGQGSSNCSSNMGPNSTLQLNANPYPNMEFVGWEGACGGTALICTVRTGESVTVTARFKAPQVPVYINYMTVPGMALKVITSPQTQPQCKEVSSNQGLKSYQCRIDVAKGVPLSIWGYRSLGGGTMPSASGKNWGGACAGTPGDVCTIMPQQSVTVTIAPF